MDEAHDDSAKKDDTCGNSPVGPVKHVASQPFLGLFVTPTGDEACLEGNPVGVCIEVSGGWVEGGGSPIDSAKIARRT
jgi:hypothetical protein